MGGVQTGMERRHVEAKVEIMVTTAVQQKDQNKGGSNQDCNKEQDVQDSQCKLEEKEGKEERQEEVKGDEDVGNGEHSDDEDDDEEDDQPPAVPLHPAGLKQ